MNLTNDALCEIAILIFFSCFFLPDPGLLTCSEVLDTDLKRRMGSSRCFPCFPEKDLWCLGCFGVSPELLLELDL